jgi:DNA-binding transcriptional ArsR family regulator
MAAHNQSMTGPPDSPAGPTARTEQPSSVPADELLDLLGDEYARRVLRVVTDQPRTGSEIAAATDVSRATVYRRLDRLEEAGLVTSSQKLDPDGHHCKQFSAPESVIDFQFGDDGVSASVRTDEQHTGRPVTGFVADD